jgi:hypothetical protein
LLPERLTQKVWATAIWVVPIVAFAFLWNWERVWFGL